MLLHIPDVLTPAQAAEARRILDAAGWADDDLPVPENHPAAQQVGQVILGALQKSGLFVSAALPLKVFPPLFTRRTGGRHLGARVDEAIRTVAGTPHRVRADLAATLFLAEPGSYDGGELVVEDTYGVQSVKLPAGHMVLYPASGLHHVRPVTRGARVASSFWIQSMVRGDAERALLFDLDSAIRTLGREVAPPAADHPGMAQLTGVYHNLLRRWADV